MKRRAEKNGDREKIRCCFLLLSPPGVVISNGRKRIQKADNKRTHVLFFSKKKKRRVSFCCVFPLSMKIHPKMQKESSKEKSFNFCVLVAITVSYTAQRTPCHLVL